MWDFPDGACPKTTGDVYRSKYACSSKCRSSNVRSTPSCQWPTEVVGCQAEDMKRSWFFNKLPRKPVCQQLTHQYLNGHRCHNRMNLFSTLAECEKLCYGPVKQNKGK
ncbi:hypothetical protein HPB50_011935 [Hyalomma asiaticum]|uniref:Uncharacterized protein n=1 Tax=Hyalomma asiaticum TaxID=266040 RepID=A0ACB7SXS1_HYAAI|nr:hypothetical protein HPB50_011935 [Hyalomma asiaticum]